MCPLISLKTILDAFRSTRNVDIPFQKLLLYNEYEALTAGVVSYEEPK